MDNTKDALRMALKLAESAKHLRGLYHNIHCSPDGFRHSVESLANDADKLTAALSAQPPVADTELTEWLHAFVRAYQGTIRNQYCDGKPIGKWIVERVMARTESPSAVVAQSQTKKHAQRWREFSADVNQALASENGVADLWGKEHQLQANVY